MLSFSEVAAIERPQFYTEWVLFEDEPQEDFPRRFDFGGRRSAMTMPPRVVKLSTAQVIQSLRIKSQVPEVEVVTKVSAKEKKNAELITEDKKAEQKNDKKKYPARKKVKRKKRRQREKAANLFDQLREEQEIAEAKNQKSGDQRQREYLERLAKKESERGQQTQQMVEFQHPEKGLFSEWNSWFVSLSYRGLQAEQHVLRSLEDTDLYLPYSSSSNPDRKEFS